MKRFRPRHPVRAPALGRRGSALLFLLLAAGGPTRGATLYVDGNCPSGGSGTRIACGPSGPRKTIESGLAHLGPGDTLEIRGIHPPHDGERDPFDGRYFQNEYALAMSGRADSRITIQPYGYSGPGTGETVFLDGTRPPSSGWTRCADCGRGICAGVPGEACSETWHARDDGNAPEGFPPGSAERVLFAQKDDGSITFRVTHPSDLTNRHPGYNPRRCSHAAWKPCTGDFECAPDGACRATSPEIDAFSPQDGGPILVRWGPTLPGKPFVAYSHLGDAFAFKAGSAFVTVQGFNIRAHRTASIYVDAGSRDHIIRDNRIFWGQAPAGSGHGYGITAYGPTRLTIEDNEIAYTVDEGIHGQPKDDGSAATVLIRGNWVHNQGDVSVLGHVVGTPSGMTLGMSFTRQYNWAGSVVENNLIANQKRNPDAGSPGYGLRIENASSGWIIRNNIFHRPEAQCIDVDGSDGPTDNNQIYNNLLIGCGGAGINFWCSHSVRDTKVYNNTFADCAEGAIAVDDHSGRCTGNVFRNNILYTSRAGPLVAWPLPGTFQNNLVFSRSKGELVSFNGRSFRCRELSPAADIDGDGAPGDGIRCADPRFVSATAGDFHLAAGSPALDAGTDTGMPPGRTSGILNTLAGRRGLPAYADRAPRAGPAWDIGAVERPAEGAPPDPPRRSR